MTDGGSQTTQDTLPRLSFTLPGPWKDVRALGAALAVHAPAWRWAQGMLVHQRSGRAFECRASGSDSDLTGVFLGDPQHRLQPDEVQHIRAHQSKMHLVGHGGSPDTARHTMAAVTALIRAGGCGVLVETACITHGPADWLKLAEDEMAGGLYWAFVGVTGDRAALWSTGMHALGLRDAELPDPPDDPQLGGVLLHNFLGYTYQSGITVVDGDPIGSDKGAMFRVRHTPCTRFPPGTPPHNPYGVWRLEKVDQ